ncbi:MAG: sigma-70 family RNA polymerase sigma factor [Bacteroidales bacterium]|nr:sigma-70 family RNA polymerase sigma factor [Bacteroidales bacterium]
MADTIFSQRSAASFEDMVGRNRSLIWHVCSDYSLGMSWNREDCVQEVLCRLWQDYGQLREPGKERAWVYRVATRTMLMLKRSRQNRPVATFPPEELQQMETVEEEHPEEENYRCLLQLIDSLPESQAVIIRAHLDGFSNKEIAAMTVGTVTGVAMRISRIRKRLKQLYDAEMQRTQI